MLQFTKNCKKPPTSKNKNENLFSFFEQFMIIGADYNKNVLDLEKK